MNARSWLTNSNAPRKFQHHLLEPADRLDVEMVRGLIQQQEVRLRDEGPTQHHAPPPAAGQIRHARIARELETRDDLIDIELRAPLLVRTVRGRACPQDLPHAHIARGRHLLGEARRSRARANPHLARVRRDLAAQELQQ